MCHEFAWMAVIFTSCSDCCKTAWIPAESLQNPCRNPAESWHKHWCHNLTYKNDAEVSVWSSGVIGCSRTGSLTFWLGRGYSSAKFTCHSLDNGFDVNWNSIHLICLIKWEVSCFLVYIMICESSLYNPLMTTPFWNEKQTNVFKPYFFNENAWGFVKYLTEVYS